MNNKLSRDTEEVLLLVESKVPVDDIADELELSASRVYQILHSKGVLAALREQRDLEVIKDYQARDPNHYKALYTMETILHRHHITRATLYKILHKHGTPKRRKPVSPIANETSIIVSLYNSGATLSSIRHKTKRSISYIYKVLDDKGVTLRSTSHTPIIIIT